MGDFKLNFRQLNLLMGIIGFNMIKFRIAAAANLGLNRDNFCRIKQLLTMPAMALLAAALSLTLSRVFNIYKMKNLAIFSIISNSCDAHKIIVISTGYQMLKLSLLPCE